MKKIFIIIAILFVPVLAYPWSWGGGGGGGGDIKADGTVPFTGDVTLDDGSTHSPNLIFRDEGDDTATLVKMNGGYFRVTTNEADSGLEIIGGNLKVGNGTPGQTIDGENFYCEGIAEFDAMIYADGGITGNVTGTATNLSGTPDLPNGTTATTQSAADKSTKLATTAYVNTPTTQTLTTADSGADADPATETVTPTANVSRLTILRTCSDDDGCTDTMAETGAVNGALVTIINIGTYSCTYATGAGVLNLKNGTPYTLAAGESLTLAYANSQWNEVTRASATFGPVSAFVVPNGTNSAPTTEGSVYCNSSTDVCTVGDGAAADELMKPAVTTITKTELLPIRYAEADDSVTAPADAAEINTSSTMIGRAFDKDADEGVVFWWHVPLDYSAGIKYRVYYSPAVTASTTNLTAAFALSGCSVGNSDAIACIEGDAVNVTDELTQTTDAAGDILISDWSTEVTVTNIAAGKMAKLLFIRDVSVDDYTDGDLSVAFIEIKYKAKINASSDY